jgi:hypothetical protein
MAKDRASCRDFRLAGAAKLRHVRATGLRPAGGGKSICRLQTSGTPRFLFFRLAS